MMAWQQPSPRLRWKICTIERELKEVLAQTQVPQFATAWYGQQQLSVMRSRSCLRHARQRRDVCRRVKHPASSGRLRQKPSKAVCSTSAPKLLGHFKPSDSSSHAHGPRLLFCALCFTMQLTHLRCHTAELLLGFWSVDALHTKLRQAAGKPGGSRTLEAFSLGAASHHAT